MHMINSPDDFRVNASPPGTSIFNNGQEVHLAGVELTHDQVWEVLQAGKEG